jgi:hypothetical protein
MAELVGNYFSRLAKVGFMKFMVGQHPHGCGDYLPAETLF